MYEEYLNKFAYKSNKEQSSITYHVYTDNHPVDSVSCNLILDKIQDLDEYEYLGKITKVRMVSRASVPGVKFFLDNPPKMN